MKTVCSYKTCLLTSPHGVTTQNNIDIFTAMRTSDLTNYKHGDVALSLRSHVENLTQPNSVLVEIMHNKIIIESYNN
jgi:hypothetical protein